MLDIQQPAIFGTVDHVFQIVDFGGDRLGGDVGKGDEFGVEEKGLFQRGAATGLISNVVGLCVRDVGIGGGGADEKLSSVSKRRRRLGGKKEAGAMHCKASTGNAIDAIGPLGRRWRATERRSRRQFNCGV